MTFSQASPFSFIMKRLLTVAALLVLSRSARAEPKVTSTELPPITIGQVTGGLVLGGVLAIGTGTLGVVMMEKYAGCSDRDYDAFEGPCFRHTAYSLTISASLGLGLGFYAVGRLAGVDNSLLVTVGGAVVGAVGGALISELVIRDGGPDNVRNLGLGMLAAVTSPVIGALVGYHYARRSTRSNQPGLVRFDAGRLQLGVPGISRTERASMLSLAGGTF